jgi:phage shock protein A
MGIGNDAMLTLVGYLGTILVVIAGVSYRVGRTESAIQTKIVEMQKAGDRHVDDEVDKLTRNVGEAVAAVRARADGIETEMRRTTTDAAIWNRDNFVRREDFRDAVESINRNIGEVRTAVDASFKRLEEKIERIGEKNNGCVNWRPKE